MSERRVAVVTGGASGMGRAIVHRLAADGLDVANLDIDVASTTTVAKEVEAENGTALAVAPVDVFDRTQVDAVMQRVRDDLGPITVLVNNAGITGFREFMKITDDEWERMMAVNLSGPFYCTQAVVPDMIDAGWGRVVNISSSSAQGPAVHGALRHVEVRPGRHDEGTRPRARPARHHGQHDPARFIDTPMLRDSERRGMLGGSIDHHAGLTPVRRAGTPDDIANACSFLVSQGAGYVTGQVIGVNGGRNT